MPILDERLGSPAQHVDEARSNGQSRRSHFLATTPSNFSDGDDRVSDDPDISLDRRSAAAVVNRAVADDDVVLRSRRRTRAHYESEASCCDAAGYGEECGTHECAL